MPHKIGKRIKANAVKYAGSKAKSAKGRGVNVRKMR